ncbi:MAG: hypothetical protein AVDCRST_MAG19-597 [uncultured Thermomicrobiales bacterium]|uniref:Uncharacterized protein n=1 Tax=uncultured Thermomicrobiales bacterium TaxID=1645740 RepID=A0A6J4UH75_9BACT|nr:MAG: hypothetical protein AVDCRST_MAG19-597 [uncultured Thermomicrobiales bacterium]
MCPPRSTATLAVDVGPDARRANHSQRRIARRADRGAPPSGLPVAPGTESRNVGREAGTTGRGSRVEGDGPAGYQHGTHGRFGPPPEPMLAGELRPLRPAHALLQGPTRPRSRRTSHGTIIARPSRWPSSFPLGAGHGWPSSPRSRPARCRPGSRSSSPRRRASTARRSCAASAPPTTASRSQC